MTISWPPNREQTKILECSPPSFRVPVHTHTHIYSERDEMDSSVRPSTNYRRRRRN